MKEKFIEFLKSNGIYDLFIYELARADIKDHGRIFGIELHLNNTTPESVFDSAFPFSKTNNGFDFWDRYNEKWLAFLEEETFPMEKDIYDKTITIDYDDIESESGVITGRGKSYITIKFK